jgi:hypothetical protein
VVERKPRREKLSLTSLKADAVTNDVELVETKLLVPSLGSQKSIGTTEVAGSGGSGGVLIYFANAYITEPKLNGLLVYLAPTFGIIIMFLYQLAVKKWRASQLENELTTLRNRYTNRFEAAKAGLTSAEADPNANAEHKKKLRAVVEETELMIINLSINPTVSSNDETR